MNKVTFQTFTLNDAFDDNRFDSSSMKFFSEYSVDEILSEYSETSIVAAKKSMLWPLHAALKNAIKQNDGMHFSHESDSPGSVNIHSFISGAIRDAKDSFLKASLELPVPLYEAQRRIVAVDMVNKENAAHCLNEMAPPAIIKAANHLLEQGAIVVLDENGNPEKIKAVSRAAIASTLIATQLADSFFDNAMKHMTQLNQNCPPDSQNHLVHDGCMKSYYRDANGQIQGGSSKEIENIFNLVISMAQYEKEIETATPYTLTDMFEKELKVDDLSMIFNKALGAHEPPAPTSKKPVSNGFDAGM